MNNRSAVRVSLKNLVLLAPASAKNIGRFQDVWRSRQTYQKMLHDMQKLRGRIYLNDGAITKAELTSDERHVTASDKDSWHLLTTDANGRVVGCARYSQHSNRTRFNSLHLRKAALATSETWGKPLQKSVKAEISAAREAKFSFVEVGGWAIAEELRGTSEALRSVLTTYAWSKHIGGAMGVVTATERNGSAAILRRLGGKSLEWQGTELPSYWDEQYQCNMEMLRFDCREPNPKYADYIETLRENFEAVPVVCDVQPTAWEKFKEYVPSPVKMPRWTQELISEFSA